jgi:hypothetical protein
MYVVIVLHAKMILIVIVVIAVVVAPFSLRDLAAPGHICRTKRVVAEGARAGALACHCV